jgi:HSP20 family molecular chaperone IbpA
LFRRLESALRSAGSPFRRAEAAFGAVPAVDVTQTDKGYEITAELPGMEEKDIDVKLTNGILTIRGEKRDEKEEKKKDYYMRERSFGSFERSFQVPDNVDADKIDASFKKGVLRSCYRRVQKRNGPKRKSRLKPADSLSRLAIFARSRSCLTTRFRTAPQTGIAIGAWEGFPWCC